MFACALKAASSAHSPTHLSFFVLFVIVYVHVIKECTCVVYVCIFVHMCLCICVPVRVCVCVSVYVYRQDHYTCVYMCVFITHVQSCLSLSLVQNEHLLQHCVCTFYCLLEGNM